MQRLAGLLVVSAALLLGPAVPRAAAAAIELQLLLDETIFLPGEELPVGVRIANLSGAPVTFGASSNWLIFYAETKEGDIVTRLGQVPVTGEFTLDSTKAGTKWWNLQPYFDLTTPGSYNLYAEIRVPEWNERLVSEPVPIAIQNARSLWEIAFGVPPGAGADPSTEPEIRRYSLVAASRQKERRLYARVTDQSGGYIHRVVLLDRLLSFATPQQQLDARGHLHVLFQTGSSSYTYTVIDPDGLLTIRQRHDITPNSRPRLATESDGTITVAGGRRTPTPSDVPPYVPPPPPEPSATNSVSATNAAPAEASPAGEESKTEKKRRSRRSEKSEKSGS